MGIWHSAVMELCLVLSSTMSYLLGQTSKGTWWQSSLASSRVLQELPAEDLSYVLRPEAGLFCTRIRVRIREGLV